MSLRVFVDANVFYSRTTRDWLLLLRLEAGSGLFQLHTTWDVITEVGARLRDDKPTAPGSLISDVVGKIQGTMDEILANFPGGEVVGVADQGDWHVHHAATACMAQILLTDDQGFESEETNYEVYSCDDFFLEIERSAPKAVRAVVKSQVAYWSARGGKQLPDALRDAGCPRFADVVLSHLKDLAPKGQ